MAAVASAVSSVAAGARALLMMGAPAHAARPSDCADANVALQPPEGGPLGSVEDAIAVAHRTGLPLLLFVHSEYHAASTAALFALSGHRPIADAAVFFAVSALDTTDALPVAAYQAPRLPAVCVYRSTGDGVQPVATLDGAVTPEAVMRLLHRC